MSPPGVRRTYTFPPVTDRGSPHSAGGLVAEVDFTESTCATSSPSVSVPIQRRLSESSAREAPTTGSFSTTHLGAWDSDTDQTAMSYDAAKISPGQVCEKIAVCAV